MSDRVDEEPRPYTEVDRRFQREAMADLSARLAAIAAPQDPYLAGEFSDRADRAVTLISEGFVQVQLNDLGYAYPEPMWLDRRQVDYNAPREPWQEQFAEIHHAARKVALDLRAVARLA